MKFSRSIFILAACVFLLLSAVPSNGDGDWELVSPLPTGLYLYDLDWDGQNLTAVGHLGLILRSADLVSWDVVQNVPTTSTLKGIAKNSSLFVAVGDQVILTSSDGVDWNRGGPRSLDMSAAYPR